MKRIATAIGLVLTLASLGSTCAWATTPQTFTLGGSGIWEDTGTSIDHVSQNVGGVVGFNGHISGMLPNPINPSTAYSFSLVTLRLDDGIALPKGCTTATPGGCNGLHQELQFLVQALGSYAGGYVVAKASAWVSNGVKTQWFAGIAHVIGRVGNEGGRNLIQGDSFKYVWDAPNLTLYALDYNGVIQQTSTATFNFYAGAPLKRISGPQVTFTMDTSGAFGGCMHDVPNYNDPFEPGGQDWSFLIIKTLYGHTFPPTSVAYMSEPSSNPQCGMFHSPDSATQTSSIWYQVDGF